MKSRGLRKGPPIAWPWGEVAGPSFDQRVIVFIPADLQQCEKGKEKGVTWRQLRVILVITAFKRVKSFSERWCPAGTHLCCGADRGFVQQRGEFGTMEEHVETEGHLGRSNR